MEVKLENKSIDEVLRIVNELRQQGLIQHTDFDFAYQPGSWDIIEGSTPSGATFTFHTEKYGTLFRLKYE